MRKTLTYKYNLMARRQIRFGIIGLGLMGREFGSAAARWGHLLDLDFQPVITGICDTNAASFGWFEQNFDTLRVKSHDYHDLLASSEIDAIYCAIPHHLHEQVYSDIIRSGKHLMGEKPFGIDIEANRSILATMQEHPDVFVACCSQFPFYPGSQRIIEALRRKEFGTIIEVEAGFLHSSDLDPTKKINWKRQLEFNGEYGCMGDLGMHVLHLLLRSGWHINNVRALLSNIVTERFNNEGVKVPCATWDNALLACEGSSGDQTFPMLLKTYRIAPGETNTWYLRIQGTDNSVSFSTRYPKSLYTMHYQPGAPQVWSEESLGYKSAYPAISGAVFEFGFPDTILQMWAAFCDELVNGRSGMQQPFYCATPQETFQHHQILTAALDSYKMQQVIQIDKPKRS